MFQLPERKRRILIVEDEELYYGQMLRILGAKGYEVSHAKTYEEALVKLFYEHFHVAIIDIWLNDGRGPEADKDHGQGVELLSDISNSILNDVLTRIILTAYPEEDMLAEAIASWGVYRYVRKHTRRPDEDDYITRLLHALNEAFDSTMPSERRQKDRINHNIHLDLEFQLQCDAKILPEVISHIITEEGDKLTSGKDYQQISALPGIPDAIEKEVLALEVYDLIGEVFNNDERIFLTSMASGLTGAAVLKATPSQRQSGVGQKYVIKIGRRDKIEREYQNYRQFVERRFTGGAVTAVSLARSRDLGAIRYRFAENDGGGELREFDLLYRNHTVSADVVANSLRMLFERTFRLLHVNRKQENISILDSYCVAFELHKKGNLERIVDEIKGNNQLAALMPDFERHNSTMRIAGILHPIPNPIAWLEQHSDWCVLPAYTCVTHGDLTGRNIMADNRSQTERINNGPVEYCKLWLIDFYRTGESHILRDHVILETDIKYRLLEHLDFENFWLLERILLELEALPPDLSATAPDVARGVTILQELRESARELQGKPITPDGDIEFLLALLMSTVNVIRLKHISANKKLHAALSASLLCSRIEYLKTGNATFPRLSMAEPSHPGLMSPDAAPAPNRVSYSHLIEELKRENLLLFIGRRAGDDPSYPTPYYLMTELMKEIDARNLSPADTHRIMASVYVRQKSRRRLVERHVKYYAEHPVPPFFEDVASLPWSTIFTTNQHTYLEDTYRRQGTPVSVVVQPDAQNNGTPNSVKIYKLYGCLSEPYRTFCPLTESDYTQGDNKARTEAFQEILQRQLRLERELLLLYPSSSDISTIYNWKQSGGLSNLNVWAVGENMGQGDITRMAEANIHYLDIPPSDLLETMRSHL